MQKSSRLIVEKEFIFDGDNLKDFKFVGSYFRFKLNIFTQSYKTVLFVLIDHSLKNQWKGCIVTAMNHNHNWLICQILSKLLHVAQDFSFALLQLLTTWNASKSKSFIITKNIGQMESNFFDIWVFTDIFIHFHLFFANMTFHRFVLSQKLRSISHTIFDSCKTVTSLVAICENHNN